MPLDEHQETLCRENMQDFSDLTALFINTSLKRDPNESHTRLLMNVSATIMERSGVAVDHLHMLSHRVPPGVYPDMTEHGWEADDWPSLWERVKAVNDKGQSIYYGKVAGSVITGNEDGVKHAAMTIGYALSHLGCTIPPQADCGWIGEAGPGPSYGDLVDGEPTGFDNDFTQRNTTIMTWNLLHLARMLKDAGGYSSHGNDRTAWRAGCRFDYDNPEYRR